MSHYLNLLQDIFLKLPRKRKCRFGTDPSSNQGTNNNNNIRLVGKDKITSDYGMSPRKRVPTLRRLSTLRLSCLVENLALTSAYALISAGYDAHGGSARIRRHVETFRDHLADVVNADTAQEVSEAVLRGAASAADARRAAGKREGDNKYLTAFMQEMFCVVEFVAAAAIPAVASLDLDKAPKIVRSRLFEVIVKNDLISFKCVH